MNKHIKSRTNQGMAVSKADSMSNAWNMVSKDKQVSRVSLHSIIEDEICQKRQVECSGTMSARPPKRSPRPLQRRIIRGDTPHPSQVCSPSRIYNIQKKGKKRRKKRPFQQRHQGTTFYDQPYPQSCKQNAHPLSNSNENSRSKLARSYPETSRFVSLDCEMVGVGPFGHQSALARVCIISWSNRVIFDTFVQVQEPIMDFRTYVSGIRAEDLETAMTFQAARQKVGEILHDKILVGHALENDLVALGISHPWYDTRDTAKYAPFMTSSMFMVCQHLPTLLESDVSSMSSSSSTDSYNSNKPEMVVQLRARRLKDLATDFLGMKIQLDGREHCPEEDARAALALYKLVRNRWEECCLKSMHSDWEMETVTMVDRRGF